MENTLNFMPLLIPLFIIILLLLLFCLFALIKLLRIAKEAAQQEDRYAQQLENAEDSITDRIHGRISEIKSDISEKLRQDNAENRANRRELSEALHRASTQQQNMITALGKDQRSALSEFSEKQQDALSKLTEAQRNAGEELKLSQEKAIHALSEQQIKRLDDYQKEMQNVLQTSLKELQDANSQKLSNIQSDINQKLDTSLNERLDHSFKTVGEQLNKLYSSLNELSRLEDGVSSLNRTLSNVKTRGIFGESQLENILANILSNTLYDKNVVTKKSAANCRDAVEFAVKIPDKDIAGAYMYLPIDSKFPTTLYDRIQDASEAADTDALQQAVRELEQRIKTEAKTIQEKYIDPPNTTDFAIMFLPTESLYAEVLRIPGLSETCQQAYHVVITGPTTISALLNSLSIGFRYMAVNRDSKNILKLLSAIKTQYAKLSALIEKADKRLASAQSATGELKKRADLINKKLSSVEELDPVEAKELLGIQSADLIEADDE